MAPASPGAREMELKGYAVDTRLAMDPERPTGTCAVMVTAREITTIPGRGGLAGVIRRGITAPLWWPSGRIGMGAGQDCWLAPRLLVAGARGPGVLGHDAQPAPGGLGPEVEVPGALDGQAESS
jgi:hypothetical protein